MKFITLINKNKKISFQHALMHGLPQQGGLYMPVDIPEVSFDVDDKSFNGLSKKASVRLFKPDLSVKQISSIVDKAFTFLPALKQLHEHLFVLELFHGPTASFKDFGAAFMAQAMVALKATDQNITVLVATSGDTGSAVAHAFYKIPDIRVVLLYPSRRISNLQEKQLTALQHNITALEVNGSFDDCQRLVKRAFADSDLRHLNLTSANSINVGRLLPQSFYYLWSALQVEEPRCFCVPSGNFGNLTAAVIAARMGVAVHKFIAAVNANDTIPRYLSSGKYTPCPPKQTLSNAMDVGDPNNWPRVQFLFDFDLALLQSAIWSKSIDDKRTRHSMKQVYQRFGYICDPHTAVGMAAATDYCLKSQKQLNTIVLATAHPGKFYPIVEETLSTQCPIPPTLKRMMNGHKHAIKIDKEYDHFKSILENLLD